MSEDEIRSALSSLSSVDQTTTNDDSRSILRFELCFAIGDDPSELLAGSEDFTEGSVDHCWQVDRCQCLMLFDVRFLEVYTSKQKT